MYHYVRNDLGFDCFTPEQFRKQVEYLKSRYSIVTLSDYLNNDHQENTCVLTFDDGLMDGLTNCLPILEELGVKANFFIHTKTLVDEEITPAQKRHMLMAKLGAGRFIEEFNEQADDYLKIRNATQKLTRFDTPEVGLLKLTLDNSTRAREILESMFKKHFDERAEFGRMYLSKDARKLLDAGMELGVHGHTHTRLGTLPIEAQLNEIETSVKVFAETFGERPKYISYPFGSYNEFTIRLLKACGFEAGLTVNEAPNQKPITKPFELNRYDCATI
jgi:peptidoglycan/xylan/chitin deacetylase (PgdA/CDA1 family)